MSGLKSRTSTISLTVWLAVVAAVFAPAAVAEMPRAVTAIDGLTLRAKPNAGARAVARLGILTEVIILKRAKQTAMIGGRKDRWIYVQADYCPDRQDTSPYCETLVKKGWVADSYLAYDERFKPLSKWRPGKIEVEVQNASWSYSFDADGGFQFDREAWEHAGKNDLCPDEQRQGPYCVRIVKESGQLHRYRNVVRAGKQGGLLYVDSRGALCDRLSSAAARLCDR